MDVTTPFIATNHQLLTAKVFQIKKPSSTGRLVDCALVEMRGSVLMESGSGREDASSQALTYFGRRFLI